MLVVMKNRASPDQIDEVVRMADFMIGEFIAWEAGKPLRYRITRELLERMA